MFLAPIRPLDPLLIDPLILVSLDTQGLLCCVLLPYLHYTLITILLHVSTLWFCSSSCFTAPSRANLLAGPKELKEGGWRNQSYFHVNEIRSCHSDLI